MKPVAFNNNAAHVIRSSFQSLTSSAMPPPIPRARSRIVLFIETPKQSPRARPAASERRKERRPLTRINKHRNQNSIQRLSVRYSVEQDWYRHSAPTSSTDQIPTRRETATEPM